jgi:hypothetical protein
MNGCIWRFNFGKLRNFYYVRGCLNEGVAEPADTFRLAPPSKHVQISNLFRCYWVKTATMGLGTAHSKTSL